MPEQNTERLHHLIEYLRGIPRGNNFSMQFIEDLFAVSPQNAEAALRSIVNHMSSSDMKPSTDSGLVSWQEFSYEPRGRIARLHDDEVQVSPIEGRFYHLLIAYRGGVVSPYSVRGRNGMPLGDGLRTHKRHLVEKLPDLANHIVTVQMVGYRVASCLPNAA